MSAERLKVENTRLTAENAVLRERLKELENADK